MNRGSFSGREKRHSVIQIVWIGCVAHLSSFSVGEGAVFERKTYPGMKLIDHLYPVPGLRMVELYRHYLICILWLPLKPIYFFGLGQDWGIFKRARAQFRLSFGEIVSRMETYVH
jgi:hypothetical protein